MSPWSGRWRRLFRGSDAPSGRSRSYRPVLECLEERCLLSWGYAQINLASDVPGLARVTDPNLVNPWGTSFSSSSPFWVSNQGTNTTSLYTVNASGISPMLRSFNIPTTDSGPQ